jgi:hypothetical protein
VLGSRTFLATPLLREAVPVGVILHLRWEVRPFSPSRSRSWRPSPPRRDRDRERAAVHGARGEESRPAEHATSAKHSSSKRPPPTSSRSSPALRRPSSRCSTRSPRALPPHERVFGGTFLVEDGKYELARATPRRDATRPSRVSIRSHSTRIRTTRCAREGIVVTSRIELESSLPERNGSARGARGRSSSSSRWFATVDHRHDLYGATGAGAFTEKQSRCSDLCH